MDALMKNTYHELVRDLFVFSVFTGFGVLGRKEPHRRPPANILRRQPVDNHPKKEDEHRIEHPPFGRSQAYHGEIQGTGSGRSCFPRSEQRQLQQILKEIGRQCGFKVRLTYHVARHTNATTVLLSHGVPIETVSRLLGHTNIKSHPNLRQNHRPEDKPRHGNLVAQVGGYGKEYLPSHLIKNQNTDERGKEYYHDRRIWQISLCRPT